MAGPAVTYTFSNSTTADATQVNQNFTDIINGLTDGTKDLSINALTVAGNASFSGNTTLGNATADDLIFTGSLASSIPIKTTNTYDIGSSTLGLRALYFGANSQTVNIKGSASMSATWTLTLPITAGSANQSLVTNGSGVSSWIGAAPTVQKFTSGSGTYTLPAGVLWIRVKMVGGGGGGAGSGTGPGAATDGGDTTFGASTAGKGVKSNSGPGGFGVGGTATLGSGHVGFAINGSAGQLAELVVGSLGGMGGVSFLGGAGSGGAQAAGNASAANSGSGGSGAGGASVAGAGGGGSGAYIDAIIIAPSGTYSYGVGAGGTAGTAGTSGFAGAAGAAGQIVVEEYYHF